MRISTFKRPKSELVGYILGLAIELLGIAEVIFWQLIPGAVTFVLGFLVVSTVRLDALERRAKELEKRCGRYPEQ